MYDGHGYGPLPSAPPRFGRHAARARAHQRPSGSRAACAAALAFLAGGPRQLWQIAHHIGYDNAVAQLCLEVLCQRGDVVQIGWSLYAREGNAALPAHPDDFAPSSPAQAAALAGFASGPRCLAQLAVHLGCTLVTAAGHLSALRRRGLVLRLGSGVYVRADGVAAPSPFGHGRGCAVRHGRDRILVLLAGGPSSLQRIAAHIGCSAVVARDHLRALRELGLVARLGRATYARTDLLPLPACSTAAIVLASCHVRQP